MDVATAIIAAAERCFERYGLRRTTMEDIAQAAGVSRKTVYNYFDNRDAVIGAVIEREVRRSTDEARASLLLSEDPPTLLVNAELALLDNARRNPYVSMFLGPEAIPVTGDVVDHSTRVAEVLRAYWRPILEPLAAHGRLRVLDLDELVDWLTFVHFVLVARPSTFEGDTERTRRMLHTYLVPALLRDTAPAQRKAARTGAKSSRARTTK